jgi:ubiquinone/menaquinone biosynthesis C-methylase UbiE
MSSTTADANFSGQVPEAYDRDMGPPIFESYAVELANRIPITPGMRVLEIAAGTGRVTRHILDRLPADAKFTVSDLHLDMLEIAKLKLKDDRIDWQEADALELPFPDSSFDLAICQFGTMFYKDKVAGHKEAHRVLKPGGTYMITTWCSHDENPWAGLIHKRVTEAFPDDPPTFMTKPFSYCNWTEMAQDLAQAGFTESSVETIKHELVVEDVDKLAKGVLLGSPMAGMVHERGGDVDAIAAIIADEYRAHGGSNPFRSTKSALIVTAKKPR